jgi:nitroimidazol reductase NimA-like FMN-containing flavoprotein (pyridoxamine 5'-phosphate oxidase superfamily)
MIIRDITPEMCIELLKRSKVGRLACVKDLQPYVVPISFVYKANHIYGFTTLGQKVDWMRANPRVCLEVDEIISRQNWQSAVVLGTYKELSGNTDRTIAHDLLSTSANWWEPGFAATVVERKMRPLEPIYFRISIDKLSGRQGLPQP